MPTVTVSPAGSRSWGLAATVAIGVLAPVSDNIDGALDAVTQSLLTVDRRKVTYQDTGRREEHDQHRLALIEEAERLYALRKQQKADEDAAAQAAVAYVPWEFFTP